MTMTPVQTLITILALALGTLMLVVYSLKDVNLASGAHGLPELIAIAVTAGVHLWKKNMILTIILGTAVYMLLTQLVFG